MAGLMKPVTHLLLPFMRYWLPDVAVRRRKFLFCFKVQHPRNSHPVPSFSLPFEFPGGSFAITWLFRGRLLHYCRILASIASPPRSFRSWPPTMWRLDLLFFSILIYSISEHYIFFSGEKPKCCIRSNLFNPHLEFVILCCTLYSWNGLCS